MSATQDYLLFTTTRYDRGLVEYSWNNDEGNPCPFLLRTYHFERLVNATLDHNWPEARKALGDYQRFKSILNEEVEKFKVTNNIDPKALRMRVAIDRQGIFQTTCAPVPPFSVDPSLVVRGEPPSIPPDNLIEVRLDPSPTESSLFTRTKTTKRAHYDQARERGGIPGLLTPQGPKFEVLLFDKDNHVMETSIYNVAFYRGGRWVTPHAKYGCLPGVFRRFLLAEGLIDEDEVDRTVKGDVKDGEYVILCNGAQGCRVGKIVLGSKERATQ